MGINFKILRKFMKVVVVGAGPAGMMAALAASKKGHEVSILEKNDIIGRKLFITGKGRCNVTNACDISDFFNNIPRNHEFLYSALYTYTNEMLMEYISNSGLKLKTERGKRVFPESDKSSDIIRFFNRELERNNVKVMFGYKVSSIITEDNKIVALKTNRGDIKADHFILATGGASYPLTGSDGAMLNEVKKLDIKTFDFKSSLIPFTLEEKVAPLAGVSLKNIKFTLLKNGKKVFSDIGEMLFTHDGISGPLVLSASTMYDDNEKYTCEIDLKPGLTTEMLEARIMKDFSKYLNKNIENGLKDLTVNKLIPFILYRCNIDMEKKVHSITKEERQAIINNLKKLTFNIKGTRPISEAIISRGGVDVKEIDPSTMKLKKFENLSVCGELVDVDAVTGGFNLQIAFSTGYLAGDSI